MSGAQGINVEVGEDLVGFEELQGGDVAYQRLWSVSLLDRNSILEPLSRFTTLPLMILQKIQAAIFPTVMVVYD